MDKEDKVHSPSHYTQAKVEVIDTMEGMLSEDEFKGYLAGCVIKYLARYKHKNGIEDLQKARWYLNKLIEKQS